MSLAEELRQLAGQRVVFDTSGPIVYLGTLESVTENGFWLTDADVHDCREGHAGPEVYVAECARDGIAVNRRRVFVLRRTVCSVSMLGDVVAD